MIVLGVSLLWVSVAEWDAIKDSRGGKGFRREIRGKKGTVLVVVVSTISGKEFLGTITGSSGRSRERCCKFVPFPLLLVLLERGVMNFCGNDDVSCGDTAIL
jgi:hypothetical protein